MIDIQIQGLDVIAQRLKGIPGAAKWVISHVINDVAVSGGSTAVEDTFKRYNLPTRTPLRAGIHIDKATPDRLLAIIHVSGKRFPIELFKPTQTDTGVDFEEIRGQISSISHVFHAVMKYGPNVFERLSEERGPVQMITGLSVAGMVHEQSDVLPDVDAHIREQLVKRAAFWMGEAMKSGGYLQAQYGRKH